MIPLLVGAAAIAIIAGSDSSDKPKEDTTTTRRKIPKGSVPADALAEINRQKRRR